MSCPKFLGSFRPPFDVRLVSNHPYLRVLDLLQCSNPKTILKIIKIRDLTRDYMDNSLYVSDTYSFELVGPFGENCDNLKEMRYIECFDEINV